MIQKRSGFITSGGSFLPLQNGAFITKNIKQVLKVKQLLDSKTQQHTGLKEGCICKTY